MSRSPRIGRLEQLEDRALPSTYFVAPTGNDSNAGSQGSPFATIQHALNLATNPGDLVKVRSGTYREKITFPASGNATAGFITLTAFPGEHPVLDGAGVPGDNIVSLTNVSFVKLRGFEIAYMTGVLDGAGVRVTGFGANIEIRDNVIHDIRGTSAMGIAVYGTSTTRPIANLIIDRNEIFDAEPAPSEALTLSGNVVDFQVTGNRVHDVNDIGIDLIGGERNISRTKVARNGVVRGNTVYYVHSNTGGLAAGICVDGGRNIVLEYNVSHHNDVGIEVGAQNPGIVTSKIIVRNNLVYMNDQAGLAFGGDAVTAGRVKSSYFVNNTLYQNDTTGAGFGQLWIQFASANVVGNNLFWGSANDVLIDSDVVAAANKLSNNLYFLDDGEGTASFTWKGVGYVGFSNYQAATGADAGSLFADPRMIDPVGGDLRLKADSPAIDVGSTIRGRFAEVDFDGRRRPEWAPDIGAFEYFAPSPITGNELTPNQKRRAEQLTSIFENDTIVLQYSYIEALHDGRGYTAGRAGFTTATGDLLDVVERYTARVPGNPLGAYLPRLRQLDRAHSGSVSGLAGLVPAWQSAAGDPVFRTIQDEVVDETYYVPAVQHWYAAGLNTALSLAALYDAIIQHGDGEDPDGLPALLSRTASRVGGTPATGVDEHAWLDAFLHVRREDLAHSYDPATRAAWAESVARVDVFLDIEAAGNWTLSGPLVVNSDEYGTFTIP